MLGKLTDEVRSRIIILNCRPQSIVHLKDVWYYHDEQRYLATTLENQRQVITQVRIYDLFPAHL